MDSLSVIRDIDVSSSSWYMIIMDAIQINEVIS